MHMKRERRAYNRSQVKRVATVHMHSKEVFRDYIVNWDNLDWLRNKISNISKTHIDSNTLPQKYKIMIYKNFDDNTDRKRSYYTICYFLKIQYRIQTCCTKFCKTFFITQPKEDRIAANNIEDYAVNFGSFPILDVNNISTYCILCNP